MEIIACVLIAHILIGLGETHKAITAPAFQRPMWAMNASVGSILFSILFWPISRFINSPARMRFSVGGVFLSTLASSACQVAAISAWLLLSIWIAGLLTSGVLQFIVAFLIALVSSVIVLPLASLLVALLVQAPLDIIIGSIFRRNG